MIEGLVAGAVGLGLLLAIGLVGGLAILFLWLLTLPFRLLGLAFKGLALLCMLPFLLLLLVVVGLVVGLPLVLGLGVAVLPAVLVFGGLFWLARRLVRGPRPA